MYRSLILVPLLIGLGCQPADRSTPQKPPPSPEAGRRSSVPERDTQAITPRVVADTTTAPGTGGADTADPPPPDLKDRPRPPEIEEPVEVPPEKAPPIPDSFKLLNKDRKNLYFEQLEDGTRRVHLLAEVCLREGVLEVLLCKQNTKEHESILHMDADAREIHFALIAAGAKPGSPVKFVPQFTPATGTKIKITLTYREKGKVKTVPAGEWIKDKSTGKDMAHDWVFAGSRFFQDPDNAAAKPFYMANNGEFISLANFPDSMLDLPVKSPKEVANLIFEIHTDRIPPLRTPVLVTLEPQVDKKK